MELWELSIESGTCTCLVNQGQLVGPKVSKSTSLKSGFPCKAALRRSLLSHCYREVPTALWVGHVIETPRRAWTWLRFPGLFMSSNYCILFHLSHRNAISAVSSKIEVLPHLALRPSLTMARWFPSWLLRSQEIFYLPKVQNQKELEITRKLRTKRSDMPKVKELKISEPGNAISWAPVPPVPPMQHSFMTVSHVWAREVTPVWRCFCPAWCQVFQTAAVWCGSFSIPYSSWMGGCFCVELIPVFTIPNFFSGQRFNLYILSSVRVGIITALSQLFY